MKTSNKFGSKLTTKLTTKKGKTKDIHKPHVLTSKEIEQGRSSAYQYAF